MISLERIESVSLLSVWMLEPRVPELLMELGGRGYVVARVRPGSLGGYRVTFIEPNVVAVRGSVQLLYNPERRMLTVEGSEPGEVMRVFVEVEEALKGVGSDPGRGVLFYELQAKARASGGRWVLGRTVRLGDPLDMEVEAVPVSFVQAGGDPNSRRWFHLDVRPLWTSWPGDVVRYEVVMVYRDEREKLLAVLERLEDLVRGVIEKVSKLLKA